MKKLVFLICILISVESVSAATITSSKYENGQISITGTGEESVQIVLFDEEKEPMYMATADASSGEYSFTLPKLANLTEGKYVIKVADYNGMNADSEEINIVNSKEKNPSTNDRIKLFVTTGTACLVGILAIVSTILLKKKYKY